MSQQTDTLVQTTRRLITELRPYILDDLELPDAIEWLANDFQTRTQVPCSVSLKVGDTKFDRESTCALFRIVQECLTNVMRHSGATEVSIQMAPENGHLLLEVADNGRGIRNGHAPSGRRTFGILGMRERVALLGGEFRIQSEAGSGTRVSVIIP